MTRVTALIAVALVLATDAWAGNTDNPRERDPGIRLDPRGLSHYREAPRRSPAGWLYAHPNTPTKGRDIGGWTINGSLEVGAALDTGNERETRYERYADREDEALLNWISLDLRHRTRPLYLRLRGGALGREDQFLGAEIGALGRWRLRASSDRLRRRYANDARSLLGGVGEEIQRLRGGLTPGASSGVEIASAADALRAQGLEVTRERSALRIDLTAIPALRAYASYRHEDRRGARPFGGSLGFPRPGLIGQAVETSEPVSAQLHRFETGLEWGAPRWQANLRYELSLFRNRVQSLVFEQPFNLGDPDLRVGRLALDPSNRAHQIQADLAVQLPHRSGFVASFSWSRHRQNERLLTPTFQSGDLLTGGGLLDFGDWNGRGALSRERADARLDRLMLHLVAHWTPLAPVTLRARYRIEDQNDDTRYSAENPTLGVVGYISEDGGLEGTSTLSRVFQPGAPATDNWRYRAIPTSYQKHRVSLEADWRIVGRTRLRAQLSHEIARRRFRARARTTESGGRIEVVSRDLKSATLRGGYELLDRYGSPYDVRRLDRFFVASLPGYIGPLPGGETPPYALAELRQSDLANRSLHRGWLRANIALRPTMDLGASLELRREDFRASFGLRERHRDHLQLQWNWRPKPRWSAYAHAGYERRASEMGLINDASVASSDANAGGPVFPRDNAWTQRSRARSYSLGGGFHWTPHRRLTWRSDYRLSHTREAIRYAIAGPGALAFPATPATAGDAFPALRYRDHLITNEIAFELHKHVSFRLVHRYERSFVRDFSQRGLDPVLAGRALFLGHVDRDYQAHVFGAWANLRF